MGRKLNLSVYSAVLASLIGCAPSSKNQKPSDVKAPAKIEESFRVEIKSTPVTTSAPPDAALIPREIEPSKTAALSETPTEEELPQTEPATSSATPAAPAEETPTPTSRIVDGTKIFLNRNALDKEFIFEGILAQDHNAHPISHLNTRIVRFIEKGDRVFMIESQAGRTFNQTISPDSILAEFPVVSSTEKEVGFNFSEGFSKLYYYQPDLPTAEDRNQQGLLATNRSWEISSHYINDAKMQDNQLIIRQVLAANLTLAGGDRANFAFENTIIISPYNPNPNFVKRDTSDEVRAEFFQTDWVYQENGTAKKYARQIPPGPMTIYISANTPEEVIGPITDGLKYWNRVFGEEKIKVARAEPGIDVRNAKYQHVLQWSVNENTTVAYASASHDPRTGEVLRSTVYIPSVSVTNGISHARHLDRIQRGGCVAVAKFKQGEGCNRGESALYENDKPISTKLLRQATDSRIRELAAHELGHILGLRHNFAGNLAATYPASMNASIENAYANELKTPNNIYPTSTVMDYIPGVHRMIVGDFIRDSNAALAYDYKALRYLYFNEPLDSNLKTPFCTDNHVEEFLDCRRDDTGNDFIVWAVTTYEQRLKRLPHSFLSHYIEKIVGSKNPQTDPSKIAIDPMEDLLKPAFETREIVRALFKDGSKELTVYRNYPKVDAITLGKIKKEQQERWSSKIRSLGGVERVLSIPKRSDIFKMIDQTKTLLRSPQYATGVSISGQPYALTEDQLKQIEDQIRPVFNRLAYVAEAYGLGSIRVTGPLNGERLQNWLFDYYAKKSREVLFTTVAGKFHEDTVRSISRTDVSHYAGLTVKIPEMRYITKMREMAIRLINEIQVSESKKLQLRLKLVDDMKSTSKKILRGVNLEDVDMRRVSPELSAWVLEQQKLLNMLEDPAS